MNATDTTDLTEWSTNNASLPPDESDYARFLRRLNRISGVDAKRAARAVICGAGGCHLDEWLSRIHVENFGKRVLCPPHAVDLLDREGYL